MQRSERGAFPTGRTPTEGVSLVPLCLTRRQGGERAAVRGETGPSQAGLVGAIFRIIGLSGEF